MSQEGDLKINIDSSSAVTAKKSLADLVAIGERAQKAIASTENAAQKMAKSFDDGQKAVASAGRSIDKYVQSLQLTAATNGKSARETKLYQLAVQGASKAQLEAADAAIRMNEGYEKGIAIGQRLRVGFIALAAAAGTAAVASVSSSIKLLDSLDDLSEKSGISVESLSALRFAGEATGTSFDNLKGGLTRLSKLMAEAAGGNKEASKTFQALGVEVVDSAGKLRSSDEVLGDLATRFAGYEDGAGKAALAQRVFGRSAEEMLPFLNLGANGIERLRKEATQLGAIYSGDLAKAAADFNDNLAKIKLGSEGAAISISSGLIKSLANLSTEFLEAKKNGGLFAAGMASYWGGVKAFWDGRLFSGEAEKKSTEQIQAYVNKLGGMSAGGGRGFNNPKVAAPVVQEAAGRVRSGGSGRVDHSAEQEARASLQREIDGYRKDQEAIANTISNGEKLLEARRSAGLATEAAYWEQKRAFLLQNDVAQEASIQKEIERLQQEKLTGKDRIDNERRIDDAIAKLKKTRENAGVNLQLLNYQEQAAVKRIADAYDRARESAQGYIDTIARNYQREIAGVGQGDKFRTDLAARGGIDDKRQQREAELQGELRRREITEDTYNQNLEVARDTYAREIKLYEARTAKLEELQKSWITGATEALSNYYDESQQIAKHSADAIGNAFKGLEDQLVNAVTGKGFDAKSLAQSIAADFARNGIKEQITGPLAKMAKDALGGGGFGDTISSLLGAGKGGSAGSSASLAALSSTALTTSTALGTLSTAALAAASAMGGASIAESGGDLLGTFISGLSGRASGGPVQPGGMYQVNEKGPELLSVGGNHFLMMGSQGGSVTPNSQIAGGGGATVNVTINQTFAQGTSHLTIDQAARQVGDAIRRAQRNA